MSKVIKPQLHQSHLSMLYRCGEKFRRVVLNGNREPSRTPLIVGTATHKSIARNLNNKIDKGILLPTEAVQDYTRDDFISTWKETDVCLSEDEVAQGIQKTRGMLQDQTIALAKEHHQSLAPKIMPKAVERKWVLVAKGYDYDLAGTIDVDEEKIVVPNKDDRPIILKGIRDTKTRNKNLGQKEVEHSEQFTTYALAKYMLDGVMPDYVAQDNLIKPTKTLPARAISYVSKRTKEDFKVLYRRFDQANKIIAAGAFAPANPSDWWCSKDFCGFAADGSCPYFNSTQREPIKEEQKDESIDPTKSITSTFAAPTGENDGDSDRKKPGNNGKHKRGNGRRTNKGRSTRRNGTRKKVSA